MFRVSSFELYFMPRVSSFGLYFMPRVFSFGLYFMPSPVSQVPSCVGYLGPGDTEFQLLCVFFPLPL